ncbi:MAG TPA: serine/threonine-protein phosphatase [Ruminococcus sp.]|nr:serine/threonine-protein phosphatase [Ruminococcus sp.]
MYYCCGITEKGVPAHNEDALLLHRTVKTEGAAKMAIDAPFLVAVCDGVSGEQAGELASRTCLELLADVPYSQKINLRRTILDIHTQITEISREERETANMQTTLCGIAIDEEDGLHCFNVGDSRLYRYRSGALEQLSRDQTLVQMLFEEGSITSEEKKHHAHRHIVMPVVGNLESEPKPEVMIYPDGMRLGDVLLLCTDGLTDTVTDYEIARVLAGPRPLPDRLRELVLLALSNGGRDNITLAAVTRYPDEVEIPL